MDFCELKRGLHKRRPDEKRVFIMGERQNSRLVHLSLLEAGEFLASGAHDGV